MALVSVVMPTYNRADTIKRAIASVQAQTLEDWELIVVDDGSVDCTSDLISGLDPRLKIVRQTNQGVAAARNRALAESRGDFIAFLDSDDEWLPHHLELMTCFLRHSGEQIVSAELWEDFGAGRMVKHYRVEAAEWYPAMARRIGSRALDLAPGESDDYLRIYETREEIGEWGRAIIERAGYPDARLYRGQIFQHLRWGFLMCLQPTVFTRRALEACGPFDTKVGGDSDFGLLARLCRRFRANYFSLPSCIKHELAADGRMPAESHIASGRRAMLYAIDLLHYFDHFFWNENRGDQELCALRSIRQYGIARLALAEGMRAEALSYLAAARRHYPGREAELLTWMARLSPTPSIARNAYLGIYKAIYLSGLIARREMTIGSLLRRTAFRLRESAAGGR